MAVHTSQFGSVRLSGNDAKEFRKQAMENKEPKAAAVRSLEKGRALTTEYSSTGSVKIKLA